MIYDIEQLFLIASKKSLINDDKKKIISYINENPSVINESTEDVFTYGEDSHLLEISLESNNSDFIEILLAKIELLKIKNLNNLIISLSQYHENVEIFKKIYDFFILNSLLEEKVTIPSASNQYTPIEKFINLVLSYNKNEDILFYILEQYHERSFMLFQEDAFNYSKVSNFYLQKEDYYNVLNLLDNSTDFYAQKKSKNEITDIDYLNIEKIVEDKIKEYLFLLKNESIYQTLIPSYQVVLFKKLDFLIIDIFKLCCLKVNLLKENSDFFNELNNNFILILIESIFKKRNFLNGLNDDDIKEIALFLYSKVREEFKINGTDSSSQKQLDLVNSIFSFNQNSYYYTFFENFKLHTNKNKIKYFNSFFYNKQNCTIEHILKLIKLHNIKNIDSSSSHNIVLSNIFSLFEEQFRSKEDFKILNPILNNIRPNFNYKDKLEEDNIHFFIKYRNSDFYKNLLDFYKPDIKTIISSILDLYYRKHPLYPVKDMFNCLFTYIKDFSIKTNVLKEAKFVLENYPFSTIYREKKEILIEIENYQINYNLKLNLGINDNDSNKKGRKRL